MRPMRDLRRGLLSAAWLGLLMTAGAGATPSQAGSQPVLASVFDAAGQPITDLTVADFAIREGGVDREVISAARATGPLHIALLIDTTRGATEYVRDLRAGLRAFIKDVLAANPESRIALWEFGQAAVRTRDFTGDGAALDEIAARAFPRPEAESVLVEAIYDASERLARAPGPRRAIVVINAEPGIEESRLQPERVNASVLKSRAQLWSLSVQNEQTRNGRRDIILNMVTRNAGGLREFIAAPSAIESYMRRFAAGLNAQYVVTYKRPAGVPQLVQTGVRRDGARVIAGLAAAQ